MNRKSQKHKYNRIARPVNLLLFTISFLILISLPLQAQQQGKKEKKNSVPRQIFAANWNLENLFDTSDDPLKDDAEFLPESEKKWNEERLEEKYRKLSEIIRSMNDGNGPDILGVEEVENREVLQGLLARHFKDKNYKIAYAESPDNRGIDVGLIYDGDVFNLSYIKTDTVRLKENYPTRLILNAALLLGGKDTLQVFVNHWPSRRGGETESEESRLIAASVLKKRVSEYFKSWPDSKIIIMGDFNDEPSNNSILRTLEALPIDCDSIKVINRAALYNLAYKKFSQGEGSFFYRGDFNMLDQIIVSSGIIEANYRCGTFEVYRPEKMVQKDEKYNGAPFPTFGGRKYLGGYSDHFPVTARFVF